MNSGPHPGLIGSCSCAEIKRAGATQGTITRANGLTSNAMEWLYDSKTILTGNDVTMMAEIIDYWQ